MPADLYVSQVWDSDTWIWDSTTGPCKTLNDRLKEWVSIVNSNPSQSGNPLSVLKDETDSTSANYRGFVLEIPGITTTSTAYIRNHTVNSTARQINFETSWSDNGANGGYGSGTLIDTDTCAFFSIVDNYGCQHIGYGTSDGEEYFICGWSGEYRGSTNQSDSFFIFKDMYGEWASLCTDTGAYSGFHYEDGQSDYQDLTATGIIMDANLSPAVYSLNNAIGNGQEISKFVIPKSSDLGEMNVTGYQGSHINIPGSNDIWIRPSRYGPYVRISP